MNFTDKSRYAKAETIVVTDPRGRPVSAVLPPEVPEAPLLGHHVLRQGERLDHLAARYLGDPDGFWRIGWANGAVYPEQLTEAAEIAIPGDGG